MTILSFRGSVPGVWRDKGITGVNEPFAVLVHSRCMWSSDGALELNEDDVKQSRVFGCV